jgi:hypothetical protein
MIKVVNNVLYMVLEMTYMYIHKNVIIYDKIEREGPWNQNNVWREYMP